METVIKNIREIVKDQAPVPTPWNGKVVVNGDNLTYVVWNEVSREALVVDPMLEDKSALLDIAKNQLAGYRFIGVIDTHTHADHISCAADLAETLGTPLIQHQSSPSKRIHLRISRDTAISTAAGNLDFLITPGHTAECITPIWGPFLFGGDILLYGDTGRDDLPGGDPQAHWESLQKIKARALPESLMLPGHDLEGGRISSWRHQLEINPALRQDLTAYLKDGGAWVGPSPKLLKESLYENFK